MDVSLGQGGQVTEANENQTRGESSHARIRYLLLGVIIGAAIIVLLTDNDASFGTAGVVSQAAPSGPSFPAGIASALLPRAVTEFQAIASAGIASAVPELDVRQLPKATPDSPASAAPHAKREAKSKKKDADTKAAPSNPAARSADDSPVEMPAGAQEFLEGMSNVSKTLNSN
ncbi:MAG TPA: hypothetical protein VNO21_21955 [Polyangiaceae bacterium]|nr:hypothetical protein [Polyangiaceae bacterium]